MVVHLGAFKSQLVATIVGYIYIYTDLGFRPFQNSGLHHEWALSDLVILPPLAFSYTEFSMNTSLRTLFVPGLVWFCIYGIHFPTDPMKD